MHTQSDIDFTEFLKTRNMDTLKRERYEERRTDPEFRESLTRVVCTLDRPVYPRALKYAASRFAGKYIAPVAYLKATRAAWGDLVYMHYADQKRATA